MGQYYSPVPGDRTPGEIVSVSVKIGEMTFSTDEIVSVAARQKVDPIYGGLPEGEMVVQLYTAKTLSTQREEKMTLLVNGLTVLSMFVKKCTRVGAYRYKLLASPRMEYLQTRFVGNIYQDRQVYEVLQELFGEQADRLDAESVYWDCLTGYISPGTRAHALEQLCFGVGAVLTCGTAGDLTFKKPLCEDPKVLTSGQITPASSWVLLPHYTRYELVSHSYVKGQADKLITDREEINTDPVVLTYASPYWYYSTETDGFIEIVDEGSNFVKFYHSGLITVYGKPWLDQTEYHTLPGQESDDPWYSYVLSVRDRTLIGPDNVKTRLQELKTLGQMRCQLTVGCLDGDLADGPRPGDAVTLPDTQGIVVGEKLSLTAGRLHRELTIIS